ncbi:MAG: hypothetical protein APR53_03360 [Methanoculleus sp. SDB]|nr:MAG: hypothetical protein APR53_03360 [Methanoculleus sp. SDB]
MIPKKHLPVIVAVCGDPGGAKAVAPVINLLRSDARVQVRAMAYREACHLWKQQGIEYTEISEEMTACDIQSLLKEIMPSLLLTGTSFNGIGLERLFVDEARRLAIPSLTIMDFWSHYCERFCDHEGNLSSLPDRVAVIDERMKEEMIEAGFDPMSLVITGNPAYDDLYRWKQNFGPDSIAGLRKSLGIGHDDLMVLFASQPLSALYGTDPSHPLYPGYTEMSVLASLLRSLEEPGFLVNRKIFLIIRPHPREKPQDFLPVKSDRVPVIVSTEGNSRELVMAADLVVGMTTALLIEACCLGRIVVSLQPGIRTADPLPTNRMGLSIGVYSEDAISAVIKDVLSNTEKHRLLVQKLKKVKINGRATERVAQCIYDMLS